MNPDDAWEAFSQRLFDQNAFAIKLGLDNIRRAFVLEGHPEASQPAIIVGGTNGKGSTASAIAAILTSHGLRVGLFTSPHLIELRERFRVDGRPVGREVVLEVGERVLRTYGQPESDPCLTFFELTTLIGALIFRDSNVDVVVWEVGLGGRLDAVNAIEPDVTVVTSIAFDHEKYLGDTLLDIAREKAGLHRPGVPLLLEHQPHPEVYAAFAFEEVQRLPERPTMGEASDLAGALSQFRHERISVALAAARAYLKDSWSSASAQFFAANSGKRYRWPGRMELREVRLERRTATFLLDAAHNPAGAARLTGILQRFPPDAVVVGAMADKDLDGLFAGLAGLDAPVHLAEIHSRRAASLTTLRDAMPPGVNIVGEGDATSVFNQASHVLGYVAVFGSIYLLGEWFAWAGLGTDDLATWA